MIFRSFLIALVALALPVRASAANILFVSDSMSDTNIPTALMADGHTVMVITGDFATGNAALRADVSAYDAVYWSSTGPGYGDVVSPEVITNLTNYVMSGGRVFVTGYDSIASPTDPTLIAFVGGTGATDVPPAPGTIIAAENSLTVGVVDIRGMTPSGYAGDRDELLGAMTGTVVVCPGGGGGASWTLRALGDGEVAYVSNGDSSPSAHASWTTVGGAYNAALRNFAQAADTGSREPGAPRVEFDGPFSADEGAEVVVNVTVTDEEGDSVSWTWDLDDDETFGETPDAASATIAAGTTDGPGSVRLGVQAMDDAGHTTIRYRTVRISNVAPTITSEPPTSTSVGAMLRYPITVDDPGGDLDPLTYTLLQGPSRITISPDGTLNWVPGDSDVTLPGDSVTIEVQVDDGDMGTTAQLWEMTVSPNRSPTDPIPVFPIDGIVLLDTQPRLVVSNADDPDRDNLVYFFEIDSTDTFDSPDFQESGDVSETPGYSFWYLPVALEPGRWHWRAWVTDGTITTEPRVQNFQVVPPEMALDGGGGEVDAGPGVDAGTPPGDGGGCSVGGAGGSTAVAFLLVALALLRRPRRRR